MNGYDTGAKVMPDEPSDECPFSRPFPEDFGDCPVYQRQLMFPTDASNRPLRPAWTCARLLVGSQTRGGWYAACGLGDAADRVRWRADQESRRPA